MTAASETKLLHTDQFTRRLYATDASVFQETPAAVAFPRGAEDIRPLIEEARSRGCGLIARTAGTSLAGQVVGSGIVVDCSRHMNRILEIDADRRLARVEPGVIRNELNMVLKPHGLFFAPETSTQNRAMMGGMFGNNSCGANSLIYGSTRDHVAGARGFLSDGSFVEFGPVSASEFEAKCTGPEDTLEIRIYKSIRELLTSAENATEIRAQFPKPQIHRRNTGYAIDTLLDCVPFSTQADAPPFNFCRLLAGSEGTLFFATELTVRLEPLPPPHAALVCVHCKTVDEALRANLIALEHAPRSCELIDHFVLECTKANREQAGNRFFVEGDPGGVLAVEFAEESEEKLGDRAGEMIADLQAKNLGYHYPLIRGADVARVWNLRKAGLGLLSNIPGDAKPVAVIEDTAVAAEDLPEYVRDFGERLKKHGLECVHFGHAASGELHLRPLIDLKSGEGVRLFRTIAEDVAALVKKYGGALSGEHGDGRLRGEFLPRMVGAKCYAMFEKLKEDWDPHGIFNPGKITRTPPMDSHLRYAVDQGSREMETYFDFSDTHGILRAAEKCNGSGDCRKTHLSGGTMCPSYMATRDEKDTTRARANVLRQVLTDSSAANPFDNEELKEVMDLCLACKGCQRECPSNVDMAKLRAEFLQHYYDARGTPMRARLVGGFGRAVGLGTMAPFLWNAVTGTRLIRRLANRLVGFHPDRTLPPLPRQTVRAWFAKRKRNKTVPVHGRVLFFADEFTNTLDAAAGMAAIELLEACGYGVAIPDHGESGRTWLSKGLVRRAREAAEANVRQLVSAVSDDVPLIGIEPSAILSFRDEYPRLVRGDLREKARALSKNALLLEEFIMREVDAGRIDRTIFTDRAMTIHLHGHCHQKAIASLTPTVRMLELPANFSVRIIPSGCCGMAGAFGYEKEHFEIANKIGELVLFPAVRKATQDAIIAAPGTSCRHQIHDGTGRTALHPAQIMRGALVGD